MKSKEWPAGLKHTRQRAEVMEVLEGADRPMTAAELSSRCSCTSMSTVYRILESLEKYDLAEKTDIPGSDMAYYKLSSGTHAHYATCLGCRRQIPLSFCPIEELKFADNEEFIITGHRLEIYGYCRECAKKQKTE